MPRIVVTARATQGLARCRRFLLDKSPEAARRAGQVIEQHFLLLESTPTVGRPDEAIPVLRELVIPFGDSGYIALYRFEPADDTVYVLAFRHQKEAGY
ncbi:plasmid stabilization system [Alcanivorax balearicus MACL04]|uniref:Plasmid stabilization system n=1 Tax=Alloalcanivorax balearicus MACL04 TaxID=1177182 RepID=A0ABT2QX97_9GAMM|nr:type II toxin-antitoxin system RelE/ParE family toxin [Alloalcanivorax balearicus]MCU5782136.1 plasmid stabilization system [Alloalcanivorax balearicus MACL04]